MAWPIGTGVSGRAGLGSPYCEADWRTRGGGLVHNVSALQVEVVATCSKLAAGGGDAGGCFQKPQRLVAVSVSADEELAELARIKASRLPCGNADEPGFSGRYSMHA